MGFPASESEAAVMNVGLVGFGMVAERFHAPLIAVEPGLRLTHVVGRHGRKAEQRYPGITTLSSAAELATADVEIVVILTPNESHFRLIMEALRAGKHVVVDKPFTVTSAQADEAIALSRSVGKLLTVFHNRRWDNDFLTARALLEAGRLGTVHRYESRWERFRPRPKGGWREQDGGGSGILYDLGSHMIDQLFCLFGHPRAIFCHLQSQREGAQAVDFFDWIGDYGRFQAYLSSNCLTAVPSFRLCLQGDAGTFIKEGLDPQEDDLAAGRTPEGPGWGEEAPELWGELRTVGEDGERRRRLPSQPGSYPAFYSNLVAALRGEAELEVKPEQARDVVRAIELSIESDLHGAWVGWS